MAGLADIAAAPRRALHAVSTSLDVAVLLALAQKAEPGITADVYAAARLVASEHGNGTPAEMACIVDAELNRARRRGQSLTRHVTGGSGAFGPQGEKRPASTRLAPTWRHVAVARGVLGGELRGVALGAERFFNPRQQDASFRLYKSGKSKHVHTCSALGLLRAWAFDLRPCKPGRRCCDDGNPPIDNPGRNTEAWVGEIAGVDAYRLMLMEPRPLGDDHTAAFEAARNIILRRTGPGPVLVATLPLVLVGLAAFSWWKGA